MAWGSSKLTIEVLKRENDLLRDQIKDLQTQRQQLLDQNLKLQEALVSKTAPQAYMDHKMKNYDDELPGPRTRPPQDNINKFLTEYVREIEKPSLFDSAEDMITKLTQVGQVPSRPSVHNNEES